MSQTGGQAVKRAVKRAVKQVGGQAGGRAGFMSFASTGRTCVKPLVMAQRDASKGGGPTRGVGDGKMGASSELKLLANTHMSHAHTAVKRPHWKRGRLRLYPPPKALTNTRKTHGPRQVCSNKDALSSDR